MAESKTTDSGINDNSDISSQLTQMKENYEKKINELHSEFSQLKDLMMAVIRKSNEDSPSSSTQGLSKQPRLRQDTCIRLTPMPGFSLCVITVNNSPQYF